MILVISSAAAWTNLERRTAHSKRRSRSGIWATESLLVLKSMVGGELPWVNTAMPATRFCAAHAWAKSSVPVTYSGVELRMGSICSILSGNCVDLSMPLLSVPAIVNDA